MKRFIPLWRLRPGDVVHGAFSDGTPVDALALQDYKAASGVLHNDDMLFGTVHVPSEKEVWIIQSNDIVILPKAECVPLQVLSYGAAAQTS